MIMTSPATEYLLLRLVSFPERMRDFVERCGCLLASCIKGSQTHHPARSN